MEKDLHDYECLPLNASFSTHLLAGALAGISEHCVMFPVDSIKTRMQIVSPSPQAIYNGLWHAATTIKSTEGLVRLWRGISSVILGAGPAHAIYFATYEESKRLIIKAGEEGRSPFSTALCGACATTISDAFMNPFDVVKQRMQAYGSLYRNALECAAATYRNEGLAAFYVSYPTTLLLNIPFQAIQFPVYEYFRKRLNPSGAYSPFTHMLAGCLAGAAASAVTTPIDVVKTLLQTRGTSQDSRVRNAGGMADAVRVVYAARGLAGFCKGLSPRVLMHMPSTAICWTTYEYFKYFISQSSSHTSRE